jgi:hypothetical protein
MSLRYTTGEEIHAGDSVLFSGQNGIVVIVLDTHESALGFDAQEWTDYEHGFLIRTEDGQLYMHEYAEEDIQLLSRSR